MAPVPGNRPRRDNCVRATFCFHVSFQTVMVVMILNVLMMMTVTMNVPKTIVSTPLHVMIHDWISSNEMYPNCSWEKISVEYVTKARQNKCPNTFS